MQKYIPALGRHCLTPLYDTLTRLLLPEKKFKAQLIASARLIKGMNVLDVGCGTGTLLLMAAAAAPDMKLIGIDPDERIIGYARRKLAQRNVVVRLHVASATNLPYESDSFDRVLSTLAFHHLTREQKQRAFLEAYRTLRPDGQLHIGDFGAPNSRMSRIASLVTERLGGEPVDDNYRGRLPAMAEAAGFTAIEETAHFGTIFGVLRSFKAVKRVV